MSHRLQVLVPERLAAAIRNAADRRRLSKGEWVRRAIEQTLEAERQAGDPLAKLASLDAPTGDIKEILAEIEAGRS